MNFEGQIGAMRGAYSAIFTPYDQAGQVNFEMLTAIAEFQLACGIQGFFACGSTGEGLLLSFDERKAVTAHLASICQSRATVIAHVGHPSTDVAVQLAKQAAKDGANWIASVAPIYHGTTFEGAMRHYQAIAEATELPFMMYSLNGVIEPQRDVAFFELPNVCGLKYTGSNLFSVQQLARFVDRPLALMSGFDEQFVAALSFGFGGGIGTTYNFGPQFYSEIYRHYHLDDIQEAARIQEKINRVTQLMASYENWSYRKAIMKYIGFDCGPARAPYAPILRREYELFASKLDELNVLKRHQAVEVDQR